MNNMRVFCDNSKCKFYYECSCQRDLEDMKVININSDGKCDDFVAGVCDYYTEQEKAEMKELNNEKV